MQPAPRGFSHTIGGSGINCSSTPQHAVGASRLLSFDFLLVGRCLRVHRVFPDGLCITLRVYHFPKKRGSADFCQL